MKLFSIVIPTFKGEDSLPIALESIVRQNYKNIEVIVSDDNGKGSEAQIKTEKVVNEFKDKLNIIYLVNEHINGSHARNEGLRVAKGDYISLLDDDDFYLKDYVKEAVDAFEDNDIDLVFFDVAIINKEGINRIIKNNEIDALDLLFYRKEIGTGSNICFKNKVYKEDGGFDERYLRQQDIEFVVKKLIKYKSIWINKINVVKYYNNNDNFPNMKKSIETYSLLRKDLFENGIIDKQTETNLYTHQFHCLLNDLLIKNADERDVMLVYNKLKEINSLSFVDRGMIIVYKISKKTFNSITKLLLNHKNRTHALKSKELLEYRAMLENKQ